MAEVTLYIGNKNYSSWSLRGWLALKESGIPFDEVVIPLDEPATRSTVLRFSPSGRVPALHHGECLVWDSLAIGEYVAELAPERQLLPAAPAARALCRSVVAEMHGGFASLRQQLPMNIRSSFPGRAITPEVQADINRIAAIWRTLRASAGPGPFLFGAITLADAAFAPVVSRFRTYGVPLDPTCQAYADAIWAWPAMAEWVAAAGHEPMIIESAEF